MMQLEANYSSFLSQNFGFMVAEDTVFTLDGRTNLYNLTQEPLSYFQYQMSEAYGNIWEGERAVSRLQSIVSIMTIATLLATAISGRLGERKTSHQVSKIRSDLKDDESIIISEVDIFSIVLLALAILIAIGGILYTFLPIF